MNSKFDSEENRKLKLENPSISVCWSSGAPAHLLPTHGHVVA